MIRTSRTDRLRVLKFSSRSVILISESTSTIRADHVRSAQTTRAFRRLLKSTARSARTRSLFLAQLKRTKRHHAKCRNNNNILRSTKRAPYRVHQQHEYSMFYLDALRNKRCIPRSAIKHREVHEREVYFSFCLKKKVKEISSFCI